MKRVVFSLVVMLAAIAPGLVAEEPARSPELVASLFPATGLIPVGNADGPIFRFEVSAQELDEAGKVKRKDDAVVVKAREETLVEPGQTRLISSPRDREWRLEGAVTIRRDGFVEYHVTLLHEGERVSSTVAGMRLHD